MPRHKSAIKRNRQDKRRRAANRQVKSRLKTAVKKVRQAKNRDKALTLMPGAFSTIDRAVKKGVVHPRSAARKKSRLAKKAASLKA